MVLSELIIKLQHLQIRIGNVPVLIYTDKGGFYLAENIMDDIHIGKRIEEIVSEMDVVRKDKVVAICPAI